MKYLVDTHFHLDQYKDYWNIAKKISLIEQYTICVTNSPGVFLSCKNMIPETKYLKFAIGFHPQDANLNQTDLKDFLILMEKTNYVGEVGLDFTNSSYMRKELQIEAFDSIVKKCAETNKVLTVHSKGAERQVLEIIRRHSPKRCIIHWYTGAGDILRQLIDEGCFISVNLSMVESEYNEKYRVIPKDRILVESDGPHTKVDGNKYRPEFLEDVYRKLALFFNDPDFIKTVYVNFKNLLTM